MTTKIRITFIPGDNILTPAKDGATNNYILIIPVRAMTKVSDLENTNGTTNDIAAIGQKGNFINTIPVGNINNIKIKSSQEELKEVSKIIAFKRKVMKNRGTNPVVFEISIDNIIYDNTPGSEIGLTWAGNDLTLDATTTPSDFVSAFDAKEMIDIDDINLYANPVAVINDYNVEKAAALTLIGELRAIDDGYKTDLNSVTSIDSDLGKIREYKYDHSGGAMVNGNVKHALYDLEYVRTGGSHYVLREKIDSLYNLLTEFRKWVDIFGFTKLEEILKANANGFILEDTIDFRSETAYGAATLTDVELNDIDIINNEKYKGFSLIEGATINSSAPTTITTRTIMIDNVLKNANPSIYTKQNIDALRSITEAANASAGVNNTPEKKDFFKNFGDPNKTDSKDLWGFKPGDVVRTGTGPGYSVNLTGAVAHDLKSCDSMNTRKGFAIQDFSAGLNGLLDLAFFDNDFEEINFSGYVPKVDMTDPTAWTNDLTNKVSKKSELLDRYFWSAKTNHNYYIPYVSPAVPDANTKAIEDAYEETKKILEAIEDTYSKDDKTKAQTAKNILDPASKNTKFKNANLKAEITSKLTEAEVLLNDGIKFVDDNKIEEAKKDKSETAKELLDKAKKKVTETQLTKLVEIIEWLENANAATDEINYSEEALLKLQAIKISTEADEKAVWEKVVKDFKEKDDDKTWVEKGLEKLEGILTNAKNVAKTIIDGIKKDDPYNVSGINNLTSIIKINEIKDLFKLCHDAYQLTKRETDDRILNALKLKSISNNSVWTTVNNYKKNGKDEDENEGYAAGALKYLQKFIEEELKKHNEILAITDETELEKVLETTLASLEGTQKEEFDKMKVPMYRGRLKLSDVTNEEEKELKELLGLNPDEYKEDTRDNLNVIEDKISKLRAYENAPETDKKGKALKKAGGDTLKSAITLFIAKMENKKNAMKAIVEEIEKKKNENESPSSESGWKTWHKIALAVVVLTILAAVVYFLKRNSSEEGE